MSIETTITLVLALVSLVGAGVTVITSLKKTPHENQQLDGDAANKYAQAAATVANENLRMAAKVGALEKRIDALEASNMTLEQTIEAERVRSRKFEDWAKRLSYQIRSLGQIPVPFEDEEPEEKPKPGARLAGGGALK